MNYKDLEVRIHAIGDLAALSQRHRIRLDSHGYYYYREMTRGERVRSCLSRRCSRARDYFSTLWRAIKGEEPYA